MRRWYVLLSLAACASPAAPRAATPSAEKPAAEAASDQTLELAADLRVQQLGSGVWLHVSVKELPGFGRVPSNGLVVVGREGALLVDTPWTPEQTQRLLAWLREAQST